MRPLLTVTIAVIAIILISCQKVGISGQNQDQSQDQTSSASAANINSLNQMAKANNDFNTYDIHFNGIYSVDSMPLPTPLVAPDCAPGSEANCPNQPLTSPYEVQVTITGYGTLADANGGTTSDKQVTKPVTLTSITASFVAIGNGLDCLDMANGALVADHQLDIRATATLMPIDGAAGSSGGAEPGEEGSGPVTTSGATTAAAPDSAPPASVSLTTSLTQVQELASEITAGLQPPPVFTENAAWILINTITSCNQGAAALPPPPPPVPSPAPPAPGTPGSPPPSSPGPVEPVTAA